MKFDVKIYGVPNRKENILKNKEILNLSDDDIIWCPPENKFPYPLMKKAIEAPIADDVTHRIILQDDVELCPNFIEYVNKAINLHPDAIWFPVSFEPFTRIPEMDNWKSPYVTLNISVCGSAIIFPKNVMYEFIQFAEKNLPHINICQPHEDTAVQLWGRSKGYPVLTTIPSMAQHIGDHSELFGWDHPNRSPYFSDWEKADWDNPTINIYETYNRQKLNSKK